MDFVDTLFRFLTRQSVKQEEKLAFRKRRWARVISCGEIRERALSHVKVEYCNIVSIHGFVELPRHIYPV